MRDTRNLDPPARHNIHGLRWLAFDLNDAARRSLTERRDSRQRRDGSIRQARAKAHPLKYRSVCLHNPYCSRKTISCNWHAYKMVAITTDGKGSTTYPGIVTKVTLQSQAAT
jgi:hypothetical protein